MKNKIRALSIIHFQLSIILLFVGAMPVCAYESEFADDARKIPLRWRANTINLALSNSLKQSAANIKAGSDVAGAVKRSLQTWEAAANVRFSVVWTDKISISRADGGGDGTSLITIAATPENLEPFQNAAAEMPGRTRLFYNARGRISEADIVLNPSQQFSTDGSFGTFDLEAALTHEIGHLLGLSHSSVLAATMYREQGKNGTFSLPAFAPRTLAEDDRAGIRASYGAHAEDENCCGAIAGILQSSANKPLANWQVWAEDATSGKIAASVATAANGSFSIGGLQAKTYRVVAQPENRRASAEVLGEISIENQKTAVLNRKIALRAVNFQPFFVGYNAQLSTLAVPLQAGIAAGERWQTVFFGGNALAFNESNNSEISISSPFLKIVPDSVTEQQFDTALPVYSFNLRVQPAAEPGEYNLRWQKTGGESIYLLGCLSLEAEQ